MKTQQPVWKLIANLGDANPLDYGGYFIYCDETGVYGPEAELLTVQGKRYQVHRFCLERCHLFSALNTRKTVLADNPYHAIPTWFADSLHGVAKFAGMRMDELVTLFCSANPLDLATAYRVVGDYHGYTNFDGYPECLAKAEVEHRYREVVQ